MTARPLQHPPFPSLIFYFNQEVQKIKVTGAEHFSKINVSCPKHTMSRCRLSSDFCLGVDQRLELSPAELSPLTLLPHDTDPGELPPSSHKNRASLPGRDRGCWQGTGTPLGKHPALWHRAGHGWQGKLPIHSLRA